MTIFLYLHGAGGSYGLHFTGDDLFIERGRHWTKKRGRGFGLAIFLRSIFLPFKNFRLP
jgi:hypothetical protein